MSLKRPAAGEESCFVGLLILYFTYHKKGKDDNDDTKTGKMSGRRTYKSRSIAACMLFAAVLLWAAASRGRVWYGADGTGI